MSEPKWVLIAVILFPSVTTSLRKPSINFDIPEGVNATLEWNGKILSSEYDAIDPLNKMDYGIISIYNSTYGYWGAYTNEYGPEISSFLFTDIGFGRHLSL